EFLRYEPDSYLDERFKNQPHIAWVVDDIDPWIEGKEIVIAPFEVGEPAYVQELLAKHGLAAVSLSGHSDLVSESGIAEFRKALKIANKLGIKYVTTS